MNIKEYLSEHPFIPVLCVFAALVLLLDPRMNIPLDDDWIYMFSVKSLLSDHKLLIHDLATPALVFHAVWGWLFSAVGGLSYTTLRISTLTLSLIPLWLLSARKDRSPGAPENPALWLLLNPLFLLLSFTFMTDVPYLSWAMLSAWLYAKGIEEESRGYILAGAVAASLAFLVRQVGAALPLAAAIAILLDDKKKTARLIPALLPVLITAACYYAWFDRVHGGNWARDYYSAGTIARLLDLKHYVPEIARRAFAVLLYLSLFTAPYALRALLREGTAPLRERTAPACLAAMLLFFSIYGGMPYFKSGGIITEWGIGRHYLGDSISVILAHSGPLEGGGIMGFMTLLSALSLLVWCAKWKELFNAAVSDPFTKLLALSGLAQILMVLFFFDFFFDRYLLPMLPAALLMAARAADGGRPRRPAAAAVSAYVLAIGIFAYWSVTGVWDYLNWNRAKWAAGRTAVEKGIPPENIDNGYEWLGVYSFDRNMAALKRLKGNLEIKPMEWRKDAKITALSGFSPAKEDKGIVISSAAYFSPLAPGTRTIYINGPMP